MKFCFIYLFLLFKHHYHLPSTAYHLPPTTTVPQMANTPAPQPPNDDESVPTAPQMADTPALQPLPIDVNPVTLLSTDDRCLHPCEECGNPTTDRLYMDTSSTYYNDDNDSCAVCRQCLAAFRAKCNQNVPGLPPGVIEMDMCAYNTTDGGSITEWVTSCIPQKNKGDGDDETYLVFTPYSTTTFIWEEDKWGTRDKVVPYICITVAELRRIFPIATIFVHEF